MSPFMKFLAFNPIQPQPKDIPINPQCWTPRGQLVTMGTMKDKLRVALLFGGRSAEHEVSLTSAAAIYRNLDQDKFQVDSLFIDKSGRWRLVESRYMRLKN